MVKLRLWWNNMSKMNYSKWIVKMRRDGEKSFKVIFVFARNRDEARKGALNIHEKTHGIDYSIASCEASRVKS